MSILEQRREDIRQFNAALQAGEIRGALVVEYTDAQGRLHRRFWNGARFADKANMMQVKLQSPFRAHWTYSAAFQPC